MSTSYNEITNTTWNATAELFINIGDNAAKLGRMSQLVEPLTTHALMHTFTHAPTHPCTNVG